jgi:hypothetical protein
MDLIGILVLVFKCICFGCKKNVKSYSFYTRDGGWFMVFNATFNNISVISLILDIVIIYLN